MSALVKINSLQFSSNADTLCLSTSDGYAVLSTDPLKSKFLRKISNFEVSNSSTISNSNVIICSGTWNSGKTLYVYDESIGRVV